MGFIVGVLLISIAAIIYSNGKTLAKPAVIFGLEWGMISILASLRLFGLFSVDYKTWIIILVGSICFICGSLLGQQIKLNKSSSLEDAIVNITKIRKLKKIYWILFVCLSLYLLEALLGSIRLLFNGYSLSQIRDISYGYYSVEGFSVRQKTFWTPFIDAFATLMTALGIFLFISEGKKNIAIILSTFAYILANVVIDGGRFSLVYAVLELVVCFSLMRSRGMDLRVSQKTKKLVKRAVVFLVLVLIISTSIRGIEKSGFLKHSYMYIAGDVVLLDLRLEGLRSLNFQSFGFASLYGVGIFFFAFVRLFGGQPPALWEQTISEIITAQRNFYVGDNMMMNAFVTPYYYLYADFGILGIIFGMFLFGLFAGVMYKKALISDDYFNIINYVIVSQMIFKTLQQYPTVSTVYAILICYFFVGSFLKKVRFRIR